MKLRELIENVDKSKANEQEVYEIDTNLLQDMCLDEPLYQSNSNRLTSYWLTVWCCTDTWVGLRVYFLDDEPVCLSFQQGRKWDENFHYISAETKQKLRDYLLSLVENKYEVDPEETFVDLDEDYGEGFEVSYPSELIAREVIYQGQKVKVVKALGVIDNQYNFDIITIKLPNGEEIGVNIGEVTVPYCINASKTSQEALGQDF